MTASRRFAVDVLLAAAGFILIAAVIVLLVDGVEQARELSFADWHSWLIERLARWPAQVVIASPVAVAVAVARVTTVWERSGQLVALACCGARPSRLAAVAGAAGLFVALLVGAGREVAAAPAAEVLAGRTGWAAIGDGRFVRAELVGGRARDVSLAVVADGRLVAWSRADEARWDGARWTLEGERSQAWSAIEASLPEPERWRSAALSSGPDAPVASLWQAPPGPSRSAWLGDRVATVLAAGLLAALAVPVARRRNGTLWVLGVATLWRVLQGGTVAAVARGSWPAWAGVALPVAALAVAAMWLVRRGDD